MLSADGELSAEQSALAGERVPRDWPSYWHDYPEISERSAAAFFQVAASDGISLEVCQIGRAGRQCIVLIMPPMTALLLMIPTLVQLSRHLPVISWEPREFATPPSLGSGSHCFEAYVRDVQDAAEFGRVETAHIITWCASVDVATEFVHRRMMKVGSAVLIAPTLAFGRTGTDPPSALLDVIVRMTVAVGEADDTEANVAFRRLQRLLRLSSAVTPVDSALQRLTRINLSTLDRARRRMATMRAFYSEWNLERRSRLFLDLCRSVPTHAVCFKDDATAGCLPDTFIGSHPELTFDVQPSGGHFAPFKSPEQVVSAVLRFYRHTGIIPR